ncbi:MAG: glutamyl-tRNA reductase [Bacteroidetes bacterium]|nr:glutamyl-tRNA reductase [Bacteroidota bacterium]
MQQHDWYAFGISHKKADFALRGHFSLDQESILEYYHDLFPAANCHGFILSTCNRTTFFLFGENPDAIELHYSQMKGSETYTSSSYRYKGNQAIRHFLEVAAGLDSQIIGDFEIIGQLKKAAILAKKEGILGGEMERLTNLATYCSRRIKNETGLSSGTSSVSYASVRMLKDHLPNFESARILIVGLGELGSLVLENCLKHKDAKSICVSNRSEKRSDDAVTKHGVSQLSFEEIGNHAEEFDAIINAAAAPFPLLTAVQIDQNQNTRLFLDLAMPAALPKDREGKRVFQVDEISETIARSLEKRKHEIPRAKAIVSEELKEFQNWQTARKASPYIQILGEELEKKHLNKESNYEMPYRRKRLESRLFESVKSENLEIERLHQWIQNKIERHESEVR